MASFSLFKYIVPEYVAKNCSGHTMLPVCILCQRWPLGIKQQFGCSSLGKTTSTTLTIFQCSRVEGQWAFPLLRLHVYWYHHDLFMTCLGNHVDSISGRLPLLLGCIIIVFIVFSVSFIGVAYRSTSQGLFWEALHFVLYKRFHEDQTGLKHPI